MPETVETPSDEATPLPTVEAVSAPRRAQGMRQVLSRVGRAVASGAVFAAKKSGAFVRARPRTASLMVGVGLAAMVAPVALRSRGAAAAPPPSPSPSVVAEAKPSLPLAKPYQPVSGLTGVDLKAMALDDTGGVAPAGVGRVAKLTVDPKLQLAVSKLLAKHKLPQVAAVMIEPSTGSPSPTPQGDGPARSAQGPQRRGVRAFGERVQGGHWLGPGAGRRREPRFQELLQRRRAEESRRSI